MDNTAKTKRASIRKKDAPSLIIREGSPDYQTQLHIGHTRDCDCGATHINCLIAKEWLKSQLGVWRFTFEARDIRYKEVHPATFPISLSKKVIELFTHQSELVEKSVCAIFAHTAADGKPYQTTSYNLDIVISDSYRVNSKRGTQFRIWATNLLRDHLVRGYTLNEKRLQEKKQRLKELQEGVA